MSTQLIQRYREAETRYREKFDRVPVFIGMFKPAIKGEEYIKNYLERNKIKYIREKTFNNIKTYYFYFFFYGYYAIVEPSYIWIL